LQFTFNELNRFWGDRFDWENLFKMVLCYHDYGKLNKNWQNPMLDYQRKKINDENYYEVLAHTDYDGLTDVVLGQKCNINKKPPHAGIGAMHIYDIIFDNYHENEGLARAMSSAILKHHSTDSSSFCSFEIRKTVIKDLNKLLHELGFEKEPIVDVKELGDNLNDCECANAREWLLYFIMVRILRLCDQKTTENIEKYYKK
jgi:CRISPR-associated endonuclease/helicase Cas3